MEIKPVEEFLDDLSLISLNCLVADRQPYSLLMLQPGGPIYGTEERVGHSDIARGSDLCRAFLQQSLDEQAELVIAPEYCVPWALVEEVGSGQSPIHPPEGAIWVLGCETIRPCELEQVVERVRENGHFVYHEPIRDSNAKAKSYLNPLTYVFWCLRPGGSKILSFVIQFKTAPSRDNLDVEQRSMIVGTQVYTFNRAQDQIGLMSIICSDAFAYTDALVDQSHTNMLLIHIQLNSKPAHKDFSRYRSRLQSIASHKDVELICLNWAGKIVQKTEGGEEKAWKNNAGSGFYIPPRKYRPSQKLIDDAHHHGVYYSLVDHWHALYLNQEPHAILFQKQKVMMHAEPAATEPVTCAIPKKRWTWCQGHIEFEESAHPNDGFDRSLMPYELISEQLETLREESPLAVERSLELLVGAPRKPERWFEVTELTCMKVGEGETIRRVTVNQDNDPHSAGVSFRKVRLQRADDAASLPGNGVPWPQPLKKLEQGFLYAWAAGSPHTNVRACADGSEATLIFLGDESDSDNLRRIYASMSRALQTNAINNGAELEKACDHLCLVYRKANKLQVWGVEKVSRIDRPPESSPVDIASGED